jgi:hypothetical protein
MVHLLKCDISRRGALILHVYNLPLGAARQAKLELDVFRAECPFTAEEILGYLGSYPNKFGASFS